MYRPTSLVLDGLTPHPNKVIESEAMATIPLPPLTYIPHPNLIDLAYEGKLSDLQLETVLYACQAHTQFLDDGTRLGFFIGDGTGLGKGRQVAGIIAENYFNENKKAVWISTSQQLEADARRDIHDVVGNLIPLFSLSQFKMNEKIPFKEGVLFVTYTTLIQGNTDNIDNRLSQILDWLSDSPDAVIVFDEAHAAKNAVSVNIQKASRRGSLVIDIQDKLPSAKIVYVSATGATELNNMAYMKRLGLWGDGQPFQSFQEFKTEIEAGGIGAMELIARELKAKGRYVSRFISYEDVTFNTIDCQLSQEHIKMYNTATEIWQEIINNVDYVVDNIIATTLSSKSAARVRAMATSQFWSAEQRFFKTLITAAKTSTIIPYIQNRLLNHNESVVISMISTGEASMNKKMTIATELGMDESDIDFTPREIIIDYLNKCFPTKVLTEVKNFDGSVSIKHINQQGTVANDNEPHLESEEAIEIRNKLIKKAQLIDFPENPIDKIKNEFRRFAFLQKNPTFACGEISGRKQELIYDIDQHGNFLSTKKLVSRTRKSSESDKEKFQRGDLRVIIITAAGSTGISLHADKTCKNQTRRHLICLETAWSADMQLQFFGRVHRSNQTSAPIISMTDSGIPAERRFISTIAKRLETLGAITRADRKTTTGNFMVTYENKYGTAALTELLRIHTDGLRSADC